MCHNVTVGTGVSYHSIVLRRYNLVRDTGIMPKDTCRKAITGPIIVQQDYGRPINIKAERPNIWTKCKAMAGPTIVLCRYGPITGPIIILRRYGPVQARATRLWHAE